MAEKKNPGSGYLGRDGTIAKGSLGREVSVYSGLGLTNLGMLDVLSMCRETPGFPKPTETSELWNAKHSYTVEDSSDRPRTPKKHNLRAVLSPGLSTLIGLGAVQPAIEIGPLGQTALHSQDPGVS